MKTLIVGLSLMMLFGCASQQPLNRDMDKTSFHQSHDMKNHSMTMGEHKMDKDDMSCKCCKNHAEHMKMMKKMGEGDKNHAEHMKMMGKMDNKSHKMCGVEKNKMSCKSCCKHDMKMLDKKDHKMCDMHKNMPNEDLNTKSKTCLNANRDMRGFKVLSSNTFLVDYGRHDYVVTVNPSCDLSGAEKIAFTQMPERTLRMNGRTIFATQLQSGQICGTGFDSVVSRRRGEDFYTMGHSCRVQSVVEASDTDTK